MKKLPLLLILSLALVSSACTNSGPARSELVSQVSALEEKVSALEEMLIQLRIDVMANAPKKVLRLDTAEAGYGRLDSNSGFFLVSVEKVQPYMDGQHLTLKIGNPLSVAYNGFEADLTWGKAMPSDLDQFTSWEASLHKKNFTMLDKLESAKWNTVTFTLPDTPTDEIRHVEISITTDVISLY